MSADVDLAGVIDTHVHTAPDAVPRSLNDLEMATAARDAGYRAIVLKSHHVSTAGRARLVDGLVEGVHVFGGLALNHHSSGGLNPRAVEVTAALGGRVVWMPTFTAASHVSGTCDDAASHVRALGRVSGDGIRVLGPDGEVTKAAHEVLEVIAAEGLALATGHLSGTEIMELVPAAQRQGVERIIVTHPEMPCVGLDVAAQSTLAQHGGVWFERVYVLTLPPFGGSLAELAATARAVGFDSTILATDLGQPGNPHPVAGMQAFLSGLRDVGIPPNALHRMTRENPATALGL